MADDKKLVIVESPAKAKTIKKILGRGFTVKASMGHVMDMPKNKIHIDMETFTPNYKVLEGKSKVVSDLRSSAKGSSMVYLCSDPDREGEFIAKSLVTLLGLKEGQYARATFNAPE